MNGKANRKDSNISGILFVFMTIRYTIAYNQHFRTDQKLWLMVSAVVAVFFLYKIASHRAIVQTSYFVWWAIAVYSYFACSILWAVTKDFKSQLKTLAMIFIMGILTSFVITSRHDLKKLMVINSTALVLCGVYILTAIDRDVFGVKRIGQSMEGIWNSNGVSQIMCTGALICFYFFDTAKRKLVRLVNLIFFGFFVYLILYCGSRSGLMILFISVLFYLFLKSKGFRHIWVVIAGIVLIMATYYLIMHYEPLYLVIGTRVEDAINGVSGSGTSDSSFNSRHKMIVSGFRWFLQRPLFGYGLDNFRTLYYLNYWQSSYAHNNFVELLVDEGIVGTGIYYSMYFYIFHQLWASAAKEKDRLSIYLICGCLGNFIASFISVINYTNTECNMLLLMANIYIMIRKREQKKRWKAGMKEGMGQI